jgi:hypothetical protein
MNKNTNRSSEDNELPKLPSTPEVEDLLKRLGQKDPPRVLESPEMQELLKLLEPKDTEKLRQLLDDATEKTSQSMQLQELKEWLGQKPLLSTDMYINYGNENKDK